MSKSVFIICCLLLHTVAIIINAFGQLIAFAVIGVLFSFFAIYLLKANPFQNKKVGYALIFGVYPLIAYASLIYSFFVEGYLGVPKDFILTISIIFALAFFKKPWRKTTNASIGYVAFVVVATALLPNYYIWKFNSSNEYKIVEKPLPDLDILDENGNSVNLNKTNNKIVVLDIWNSSCGICIKKFPDFERLKNEFSKDSSIVFYTLNLPIKQFKDDRKKAERYTNSYTFGKLYADASVQPKLDITSVPQYMIIDKNRKVRYLGSLNTGTFDFYDNFYAIIDKIK